MTRTILTVQTTPNLTTGVLNAHGVEGWFFEQEETDPEYTAAVAEAEQEARVKARDEGEDEDGIELAAEVAGESFSDSCWESSYILYGGWMQHNFTKLWEPDPIHKSGFSAIFNRDSNVIQVTWSKHYMECNQCSPCYPLQGDLDTDGSHYTCYALPPSMMSESWLSDNQHRYMDEEDRNYKP